MNTMSAVVMTSAADGGGSNVWELVPSGTMPTISAQSPMTFAAIEVIGATVVTTWNSAVDSPESAASAGPSAASSEEASSLPQAAATRARAATPATRRRVRGVDVMAQDCSCDLVASTVVLEVDPDQGFRALSGAHLPR